MQATSFLRKHLAVSMLLGVVLVVLGVFVMSSDITLIAIVMGVALIFSGVSTLRNVLVVSGWTGVLHLLTLLKALCSIVLGIIGIAYARQSFTFVMYLMGAQMFIGGIISVVDAMLVGEAAAGAIGNAVFSFVLALVLFLAPNAVGETILVVAGLAMVLVGLAQVVASWRQWRLARNLDSVSKESTASAEIIDEKDVD